ncbi:uncharacterized protein LOC109827478 [Asparagus officinalis]|uniref:uncharacterized protein LOC109827478 n=1 Tax=Asparagus officinalis TaxID=4686 RepID=UPI00098E63D3|nr:uncharacterized protein LOC109827478 [Asparagus officinalis]
MAATVTGCQVLWLRSLVSEVTCSEPKPVTLFVDNKSAIALMKNPIKMEFVSTSEQLTDILTKALARVKFIEMRELLGKANRYDLRCKPSCHQSYRIALSDDQVARGYTSSSTLKGAADVCGIRAQE